MLLQGSILCWLPPVLLMHSISLVHWIGGRSLFLNTSHPGLHSRIHFVHLVTTVPAQCPAQIYFNVVIFSMASIILDLFWTHNMFLSIARSYSRIYLLMLEFLYRNRKLVEHIGCKPFFLNKLVVLLPCLCVSRGPNNLRIYSDF